MEITRNTAKNQFETTQNGQTSVAQYELNGDIMTITHVIVPRALRGQGIASALATFVIETARADGWKIVPQCPWMATYFARHPDQKDILA